MEDTAKVVTINGKLYKRDTIMIGDVEKVYWLGHNKHENTFYEIYDQELRIELEDAYEAICMEEMSPKLFFI